MKYFTSIIFAVYVKMVFVGTSDAHLKLKIIDRLGWGAQAPREMNSLKAPVPYVVIHHSFSPEACYDTASCKRAMKAMQDFHMGDHGWADIGYNWAVGSDGIVYEGRGWERVGAHALHFNNVSIGICLIGDWTNEVPPIRQLRSTALLVEKGLQLNYIRPDYKLVGHRQVRETECPGQALFDEIHQWDNFSSFPRSADDLSEVFKMLEEEEEYNQIPSEVSK